jgi:hypothetical protein
MSTTPEVIPSTGSEVLAAVGSGDLSMDKTTYRAYVKLDDKGEIIETVAKAEVKDQTNWKKLEEGGYKQWNENVMVRYTVKSMAAFEHLVPDEAQRVYIAQVGINYVQNSKANGLAVELKEGSETEPAYNNEEIDLREYINMIPSKRALTPLEKLERQLAGLGLDPTAVQILLAQASKKLAMKHNVAPSLEAGELPAES